MTGAPSTHGSDPSALPIFAARAAGSRPQARALAGPLPPPPGGTATPGEASGLPGGPGAAGRNGSAVPGDGQFPRVVQGHAGGRERYLPVLDYTAVQQIRDTVAELFQEQSEPGTVLTPDTNPDLVLTLIDGEVRAWSDRQVRLGNGALSLDQHAAMSKAVHDHLFGLGRITPLLDLPGLQNLEAEGCDNVWLEFDDGRLERGPAIADSDEQMIADLQAIARTAPGGEKQFSPLTKTLRMALPDGSRLAAEAWVTARPSITTRKHQYVDIDLEKVRDLGAIDQGLLEFCTAAIRAGKCIIVCGLPAAGKTFFIRALLNMLDPHIRLATVEAQFELFLHQMPHRHYRVWPAEAHEGGELGEDGKPIGAVSLRKLLQLALQKNADRIILGEVTGDEILVMLESMQGSIGSVSTMHSKSAWDTVERIVTLVTGARANVDTAFAQRLVAQNVDLIIHIGMVDESHLPGGRKHRFVDEVMALGLGDEGQVTRDHLWKPGPDGRAVPTGKEPPWIGELELHGFDRAWLTEGHSTWGAPLDLLRDPQGAR